MFMEAQEKYWVSSSISLHLMFLRLSFSLNLKLPNWDRLAGVVSFFTGIGDLDQSPHA